MLENKGFKDFRKMILKKKFKKYLTDFDKKKKNLFF